MKGADAVWYLRQLDLFQDLNAEELMDIKQVARPRHYETGARILRQGQKGVGLFILKEGFVRLSRETSEGQTIILAILQPGDVFGDLACLGQEVESCAVEALTPAQVCLIPYEDLEKLIQRRPTIAMKVIRALGHRLGELQRSLESAYTKTAKERLIDLLVKLCEQHSFRTRLGWRIRLRLTQREIAAMIGVTRETVAVLLGELRSQGLVSLDHHYLVVADPSRLQKEGYA